MAYRFNCDCEVCREARQQMLEENEWERYVWYYPTFDSTFDYPQHNAMVGCIDLVTGEQWYSYVVMPHGQSYFR